MELNISYSLFAVARQQQKRAEEALFSICDQEEVKDEYFVINCLYLSIRFTHRLCKYITLVFLFFFFNYYFSVLTFCNEVNNFTCKKRMFTLIDIACSVDFHYYYQFKRIDTDVIDTALNIMLLLPLNDARTHIANYSISTYKGNVWQRRARQTYPRLAESPPDAIRFCRCIKSRLCLFWEGWADLFFAEFRVELIPLPFGALSLSFSFTVCLRWL